MPPPRRLGLDSALLVLLSVVFEGFWGAVDVWLTGGLGMGAPLIGMASGLTLGLALGARRDRTWLTRVSLRQMSVRVGLGHFLIGGTLWGVVTGATGPRLLLGVGAIGALAGLSAVLMTMCAGDAVAMVLCPFPDPTKDGGPVGPWRRR